VPKKNMKLVVEDAIVSQKEMKNNDEIYMREALKEAKKAYQKQEIPVGAIIVYQDKIIARAHNTRVSEKQVFTHAEIKAINKACKKINSWVLEDCTIYVTLEPCMMCTGGLLQSRIKRIVYATNEPKHGVIESIDQVLDNHKLNHHIEITKGILQEEASQLLKNFFHELRQKKKNMI
jgi:tRNA(adenine34) deaminase